MVDLESFNQYFGKFSLSFLMLAMPFIDQLNVWLKVMAMVAGIVLTIYTIVRMGRDIQLRNEEVKIKRLERREKEIELEQKIKSHYE